MANDFYNNTRSFTPGTVASGSDVDDKFDAVAVGMDTVQLVTDSSVKLSNADVSGSQELADDAATRASKVLGFNALGELTLVAPGTTWQGDWAAGFYRVNDVVVDAAGALGQDNIYICIEEHTGVDLATESAKWALMVDIATLTTLRDGAVTAALAAASSETAAAASETAAAASETAAAASASSASSSASDATLSEIAAGVSEGKAYDSEVAAAASAAAAAAEMTTHEADTEAHVNGLKLGGTAAANLLDFYGEGTFTATLETGATSQPTRTGHYTRIGNLVTVNVALFFTDITLNGTNLSVSGLPFAVASDHTLGFPAHSLQRTNFDSSKRQFWRSSGGSTTLELYEIGPNATSLTQVPSQSTGVVSPTLDLLNFTYRTDA